MHQCPSLWLSSSSSFSFSSQGVLLPLLQSVLNPAFAPSPNPRVIIFLQCAVTRLEMFLQNPPSSFPESSSSSSSSSALFSAHQDSIMPSPMGPPPGELTCA